MSAQPQFSVSVYQNEFLADGAAEVNAIVTVTSSGTPTGTGPSSARAAQVIMVDCSGSMDYPPTKMASARQATNVPADDPVTALRAALRDANQKITTLNGRLDALATLTANLYHENQALRAALGHRTRIAPLPSKKGH